VNGKYQVYFPGGDGVLYALNPDDGSIIWQCDLNPKDTQWELGGAGTRNAIISTPVFYDNSVLIAVGQDPEHGEGIGHFWRIDATKTGDVSAEVGEIGKKGSPNENAAIIWHYGGIDTDGSITGEKDAEVFHRTMSTVSVYDGMVFIADLSGRVHCVDLKTGKRLWMHDLFSEIWGSTMAVDGHVWLGNGEGTLTLFKANRDKAEVVKTYDSKKFSAIYSTPTIANGKMFVSDRSRLYVIKLLDE
jgi:outer membrane protein assembly factor BamB